MYEMTSGLSERAIIAFNYLHVVENVIKEMTVNDLMQYIGAEPPYNHFIHNPQCIAKMQLQYADAFIQQYNASQL